MENESEGEIVQPAPEEPPAELAKIPEPVIVSRMVHTKMCLEGTPVSRNLKGQLQKGNKLAAKGRQNMPAREAAWREARTKDIRRAATNHWKEVLAEHLWVCLHGQGQEKIRAIELLYKYTIGTPVAKADINVTGKSMTRQEEAELIARTLDERLGLSGGDGQ